MTYISLVDAPISTLIEQQVKDSFFCNQAWLDLITKLYGYSPVLLTTTNTAGQLTGLLPLCYMRSPLTGRRLVSLPFSDYCPLFAEDEVSANELIDQAIQLAQKLKVRYLELRTGLNDVASKRLDLTEANLYVRWLIALAGDANAIWEGLRKPVQNRIKRSRRLGVRVHIAQHREEMEHYYQLHLLTRSKKHGMPPQSIRFFYDLWDAFAPNGTLQLLLAEYEGSIIAATILLASGTSLRCAYSASDDSYLHLAPNNLLFWTAIEQGCAQGYKQFDLGRTARDNKGLMDFKQRWGAIMEPLPYYYYPQMAGLAATSESSWKYQLLTRYWKKLPLPVAACLGGYLYKHLG